jgi:predicted metal-dependent HD superfamily phosphohydrolase
LDLERWTVLWHRLGAQGDGLAVFNWLAAAYAEPIRAYHTAEHIEDCLAQLDATNALARRADEVEAAIWFHDAVYVPARDDNEEQSAVLAHRALSEAAVPPAVAERIRTLVLATRHATTPNDPDASLLCDIDLSILGRSPEVFDRFERQIRREYAWVPEMTYRSARSKVLGQFLRRPSIYQTIQFRELYEERARANLARLLGELGT